MSKQIIVAAIAVMALAMILTTMPVPIQAKKHHNDATTRTTGTTGGDTFSDGLTAGKAQGIADQRAGVDQVVCGYEHSLSYCAGYRLGYRTTHGLSTLLH